MKCLESDPLIRATESQMGGVNPNSAYVKFKKAFIEEDYPFAKYDNNEDEIKLDMENYGKNIVWKREEVFEKFAYGVTFKCKIPQNNKCRANFECPKLNTCEDGVCRGGDKAPCSSNE